MSRHDVVITVAGALSATLRAEFDDLDVTVGRSVTRIYAARADPSVLNGLLRRVEALGLELLDVRRVKDP